MKNFLKKAIWALFCAVLLVLPIFVSASQGSDLSRPGSEHNEELTRADMLEILASIELCPEERNYLNSLSGDGVPENIIYDTSITTSVISALFSEEESRLSVYAKPYSYISRDMSRVVWIPVSATVEGVEKSLSETPDGSFYTVFESIRDTSDDAAVHVKYALNVTISRETANFLVNRAYTDAPLIKSTFEEKRLEHSLMCERYEEYLESLAEYNTKKELYDAYVSEYTEYAEKKALYEQYLADLSEYELQKAAYDKYALDIVQYEKDYSLYAAYLNEYKIYQAEYAEYAAYVNAVTPFRNQLLAIELADIKMTELQRSARSAINGNLVDSVLAQRDSLESPIVNAPEAVIDMAGEATERLRVLMEDYFSLETEPAKYAYYAAYYEQFRDNFVKLFIALDYLYGIGPIRAYAYDTDKEVKYRILLAELYYIATALSDTPIKSVPVSMVAGTNGADSYKQFTYNSSYLTADGYKLREILGAPPITDTDTATPYNVPFPNEVEEPIAPQPVAEPVRPERVFAPNEVIPVSPPGAEPAPVENPGAAPETVEAPGEAPTLTEVEADLISAYEAGKLSKCNLSFANDVVYTAEKVVAKRFIKVVSATVTFIGTDGMEAYSVTVDSGSVADYRGALPEKEEDERASYEFSGWADADGNAVSLNSVNSDLRLYPAFKEIIKSYDVSWIVDGVCETVSMPYGTSPTYDKIPTRAETDTLKFAFAGWDKEIVPVTADVQYTAVFSSEYIIPTSGGGASLSLSDGVYIADFSESLDSEFLISEILSRAYGTGAVRLLTRHAKIELSFSNVKSLCEAGAVSLKFISEKRLGAYRYSLLAIDGEGNFVELENPVKIITGTDLEYNERLRLYMNKAPGVRGYSKFELSDRELSFSVLLGKEYILEYEYSAIAASSELVSITLSSGIYSSGSSVGAEIKVKDGMRLSRLYYRSSDGTETELGSSRFTMPADDIILIAEAEYIRHRVSFVSEGKVISSYYCKEGELPKQPESPKKPGEGGVSYVFRGWSPEIGAVSGETVYTAIFEPVAVENTDNGAANTDKQKQIVTMVVLGIALGALILVTVEVIRRRRYK